MDPNHDSPSPQPPVDSPHNSPLKSPAVLPPLPRSPSPQPPQPDDQDALLQSPVDSQETVVSSDSDPSMKTFVVKYGEYSITLKRPRHCFNLLDSATPDSPQSKRRIVSPISSDYSSESDYSLDSSSSDYSLDSSSSDRDSSTTSVSSDSEEPSSP
ncbi:hypothetical protein QL285_092496 [Trifolium repens]|nr:hypothetical protein QL285_092491 [Trifolium repens]KAK2355048.1 hypothetical protein QL285_092496 [Trifolium repens]